MSDELDTTIESLAAKIEATGLSAPEAAVLDALLAAAGAPSDDVEGYARKPAEQGFGLPDLRGRMRKGLITWGGDVATLFPSRNVVVVDGDDKS